ncbi:LINE-1 reverse transcriptase, partial [Schistosoma japonicum]
GSIEDCRSFWGTCLDSDHALVRARICLKLTGRRKDIAMKPLRVLLNDNKAKNIFQEQLEKQLGDRVSDCHPEAGWNDIKKAVETAMISASKVNHKARMKPWISVTSTELIDARKLIPPGSEHDEERSELRRRLIKSLRNDREQWWETGIRDPNVSETISERDGIIIHSQSRRLDRWAEHFRDQFNWPSATLRLPTIPSHPEWQIDLTPPSLYEVEKAIGNLKRGRAAGPDRLTPEIFKDGGPVLAARLTEILGRIWEMGVIPSDWSQSLIVPIYKKGQKSSSSIILKRLTRAREEQTRENQARFRPGRGCIDHIFTLRQVLEHRHTFKRPTIVVFLDLKAAFDSVDREVLWQCLSLKGVPKKYINLVQALYSKTTGRVRAYGELSSEFLTSSGVRQGCPLSPFLFNFVIDMLLDITMSSSDFSGVDFLPGASLTDLEYADDIVLFGEDADKMQSLLTTLSNNASMFGMRFSPSKLISSTLTFLIVGIHQSAVSTSFTEVILNELSCQLESSTLLFADNVWIRKTVYSDVNHLHLQSDLDDLTQWSQSWGLETANTKSGCTCAIANDSEPCRSRSLTIGDFHLADPNHAAYIYQHDLVHLSVTSSISA